MGFNYGTNPPMKSPQINKTRGVSHSGLVIYNKKKYLKGKKKEL
jgi:hypothetical protein